MEKQKLNLQFSESVVVQVAAQIYVAHISSGVINTENKDMYMQQSIEEAIKIAKTTDDLISSDVNALGEKPD